MLGRSTAIVAIVLAGCSESGGLADGLVHDARTPDRAIGGDAPRIDRGPAPTDGRGADQSSAPAGYEGFGAVTKGAASSPAGETVYRVTSLADSGSGTLRDGVSKSGRRVVFDVAGTITLRTDLIIRLPYITVDGLTAPKPGITLRKSSITNGEVIVAGTHDVIITHLRFHGLFKAGAPNRNNAATIAIDGDAKPDFIAQRIILVHLTSRNATDGGPDIWGAVRDVTVSWSFFFYNWHPTTVSHYPSPFQVRERISMHHNVYAKNGERNPQIRADTRLLDYVNNVVYDWGFYSTGNFGYGVRVKNVAREPSVRANIVNNHFALSGVAPHTRFSSALIYGIAPGPDADDGGPSGAVPAQGTVVTTSKMGALWVSGNVLPTANRDHYSTVAAALPIAAAARVTTFAAKDLATRVLPHVGPKYRTSDEQRLLDEIKNNL